MPRHLPSLIAGPSNWLITLTQRIEALDGILETRLAWWREHWDDARDQTQAAHPPDGVGELVRSPEDRVVVELRVGGQPVATPALQHGLERGPCTRA